MRITIEIDSEHEFEKLSAILKTFKIGSVKVISTSDTGTSANINKGDKRIDPKNLFGIWANEPRVLENIRKDAWRRNSSGE